MPFYNSFKSDQLTGAVSISADANSGALRVILISGSYTPDIDAHTRYRDVSAHEVSVTGPVAVGYFPGGQPISGSLSFTQDNTNDRGTFDSAIDNSWTSSTITARYAVILKQRASGANKELDNLVGYIDFGSNQSSSNGTFQIVWNSSGIILFT